MSECAKPDGLAIHVQFDGGVCTLPDGLDIDVVFGTESISARSTPLLGIGTGTIEVAPLVRAVGLGVLGESRAEIDVIVTAEAIGVGVLGLGRGVLLFSHVQARALPILGLGSARAMAITPRPEGIAAIRYSLTLTGGDGDIVLPISSWQMRRRSDGNAWLSCVVPGATAERIADISARLTGNLILRHYTHMLSGAVYVDTVLDVPLTDFQYDRGTKSASVTLSSNTVQQPLNAPQTLQLYGDTYRAQANGVRRARLGRVDPEVQPGDTVIFSDGESWVVGSLVTWTGVSESNMELTEAEAEAETEVTS